MDEKRQARTRKGLRLDEKIEGRMRRGFKVEREESMRRGVKVG